MWYSVKDIFIYAFYGGGTEIGMDNMNFMPVLAISTWAIVMIVVIVLLIAALVALSIYGRKLQARQESSQRELENAAQSVSMPLPHTTSPLWPPWAST